MAEPTIRLFLSVSPIFELSMGYRGPCRWVAFYRPQASEGLLWIDNPEVGGLQANTEAWERFCAHPWVAPHLAPFNLGAGPASAEHALLLDRWSRCFHVIRRSGLNSFLASSDRRWPPADRVPTAHARRMYHHMDGDARLLKQRTIKYEVRPERAKGSRDESFSMTMALVQWYDRFVPLTGLSAGDSS